jgi:uncharacterized protein (DUF1697 family)
MPRYAAFLRGVSPINAKMADLKLCFESIGFTNVVTVLSSGNVVFDTRKVSESALERKIEAALEKNLGRTFSTIVRSRDDLSNLLESNPFQKLKSAPKSKRVITLLKNNPDLKPKLPIKKDGVCIFMLEDQIVYSTYVPHPKGIVFMSILEKLFGKSITTRTWETIEKVAKK